MSELASRLMEQKTSNHRTSYSKKRKNVHVRSTLVQVHAATHVLTQTVTFVITMKDDLQIAYVIKFLRSNIKRLCAHKEENLDIVYF